jgi:hypothetical protein
MLRGNEKVSIETGLPALAHNPMKKQPDRAYFF